MLSVSEAPPVALLFAECDWKDWVSQSYPDKYRQGAEWEIRQEIYKVRQSNIVTVTALQVVIFHRKEN